MQVDLTGNSIHHTHTKVDSSAPRPPMKFHLCTSANRPEGRLLQKDVNTIGELCWLFIQAKKLKIGALASVPRVGDEIAKALQRAAKKDGVKLPRLQFSKYMENGVSYIGPLVDNDGYKAGQAVWLVDDLVHKGLSKQRMIARVKDAGYKVAGILVFMDYNQGARQYFAKEGVGLRAVVMLRSALREGRKLGLIDGPVYRTMLEYLTKTRGV